MSVHFSSATSEWETPQWLFDRMARQYPMETDVCATSENAKCARYFTREMDGLAQPWSGHCWMNPPYGREIGKWVRKARESAMEGSATVVCLLPARTDTRWFHDHCALGEVILLRGRLRFSEKGPAPFPSAIVIFHAHLDPGGTIRCEGWNS